MEAFIQKLKAEREFNNISEQIKICTNSNFEASEIKEMIVKLKDISDNIKSKEKET